MPAAGITIQEVKTKKHLKAFLRFPWQIYRGDPYWVPPVLKEHAFYFSPKNPFLHHAEIYPCVAMRGCNSLPFPFACVLPGLSP